MADIVVPKMLMAKMGSCAHNWNVGQDLQLLISEGKNIALYLIFLHWNSSNDKLEEENHLRKEWPMWEHYYYNTILVFGGEQIMTLQYLEF